LLVTAPALDFVRLGRQVLGEVPALAFLLLAFLAWRRAVERPADRASLALASLAFGLTALTKPQVGLVLGPTLVCIWLVDRLYYRRLGLIATAAPAVAVVAA